VRLETAFILTLKNPCFVYGMLQFPNAVEMPSFYSYKLGDFQSSTPPGIAIADVSLLSVVTPLCQAGVSYEVNFNGAPVTFTSSPARFTINTAN